MSGQGLVPSTIFHDEPSITATNWPMILRPSRHAQGKNLWLINNMEELLNVYRSNPVLHSGWYASEYIPKVAEYRVFVVSGKVAAVAQKTPRDPSAIAWNQSQGASYSNVKFGEWNLEVIRVALLAFQMTGGDFSGVDVMLAEDGRAYVLELNSAPTITFLSTGEVSYRHKCMAKCFSYIAEHGKENLFSDTFNNWRDVIHPSILET